MSSASETAYELLKQRLVAGSYPPGAQLKEEPIARELGLSRTPVRAALKRLIEDGLATVDAGRGVRVAQWTDADILETYHLRSLLEAHAAQRAAQRGDPAVRAELERLNREMAAAIGKGGADMVLRLQAINSRFHRTILDGSGSPRLKLLLASIIDMPIVVRSFFVSTRADLQQSLQHHKDITAAIASGDGEVAAQAMQLHLRLAAQRFFQRRAEFVQAQQPAGATRPPDSQHLRT
ncbi:GntR family transcriptional regulator [Ramlibacter sp.]|uniref:GntR family transcriptional regulator n=1 Tax=Ramlibacter sp. TaxID=1917967 RepID=UPI002C341165|nr:GntR family transcriptional regulator [Ramlibacter sp.]HWI84614.1 GntR family transcriptional regulator [Ramlibacter sp.]